MSEFEDIVAGIDIAGDRRRESELFNLGAQPWESAKMLEQIGNPEVLPAVAAVMDLWRTSVPAAGYPQEHLAEDLKFVWGEMSFPARRHV